MHDSGMKSKETTDSGVTLYTDCHPCFNTLNVAIFAHQSVVEAFK